MLKYIDDNKILSGADAEIWVNGIEAAYAKGANAKYEFKMGEINTLSVYNTGNKIEAYAGKGSLTVYKTNSFAIKLLNDFLTGKSKIAPDIKIMAKETNAYGEVEQKVLNGVKFTDLTLFNVEAATSEEIEMPFVFYNHEIVEVID